MNSPVATRPTPSYTVLNQNSAASMQSFKLRIMALSYARLLAKRSSNYAISVHCPKGLRICFLTDCGAV